MICTHGVRVETHEGGTIVRSNSGVMPKIVASGQLANSPVGERSGYVRANKCSHTSPPDARSRNAANVVNATPGHRQSDIEARSDAKSAMPIAIMALYTPAAAQLSSIDTRLHIFRLTLKQGRALSLCVSVSGLVRSVSAQTQPAHRVVTRL